MFEPLSEHSIKLQHPGNLDINHINQVVSKCISKECNDISNSNEFNVNTVRGDIKKLDGLVKELKTSISMPPSSPTTPNLLSSYSEVLENHQSQMDSIVHKLDSLLDEKTNCNINTCKESGHSVPTKLTSTPISPNNPTKFVESCKDNFVDGELSQQISTFLDNCDQFNNNVENGHSVINFGEPYHYTGSKGSQEKTEIPEPFITLIKAIKSEFPHSNINSVLINRYSGPGSSLPKHSDNELSIEPGSLIFSGSLVQSCKITFNELHGDRREELLVNNNSMYTMTQTSQWFWTHVIDAESTSHFTEDDVRYSITLRSVHPRFHNSTVIVGDSNTKHLKFGEGQGSFGYYYPGRRIQAPLISDIDVTACAGYSNVILHCGINDIKHDSIDNIDKVAECFDKLRHKIEIIQKLCPTSRLIVSPILPTKDPKLSAKALDFNEMLFCLEDSVQHFKTLNFNCFCDMNGIILGSMGCHTIPRDKLHLGSQGIRKLVKLIKDCIKVRKVSYGRSYASTLKGVTVSPIFTNTNSPVS